MSKSMSKAAAARIQATEAKSNNGKVAKGGFAARAQAAAANNTPPNGPSKTGEPSGKGRGNNPPKSK